MTLNGALRVPQAMLAFLCPCRGRVALLSELCKPCMQGGEVQVYVVQGTFERPDARGCRRTRCFGEFVSGHGHLVRLGQVTLGPSPAQFYFGPPPGVRIREQTLMFAGRAYGLGFMQVSLAWPPGGRAGRLCSVAPQGASTKPTTKLNN